MNKPANDDLSDCDEVLRLAIGAHCGESTAEDARRLNEILSTSSEARRAFLLAAQDTHDLRDWAMEYSIRPASVREDQVDTTLARPMATEKEEFSASPRNWWNTLRAPLPRSSWQIAGALAFVLGVAAAAGHFGWRLGRAELAVAATESTAVAGPSIAHLTMANGCSWSGGAPPFADMGNHVRPGDEISLHEGIAEFRLASDVSVSIEGPAALVLTSSMSMVLQHGRVTVYVPPARPEFRIVTPLCRITGEEAEFGVHVAGASVDVHSFAGQIEVSPVLADDWLSESEAAYAVAWQEDAVPQPNFTPTSIQAGQCLHLASNVNGGIDARSLVADETQFATKLSMAGKLPISPAYVRAIKDSKPLGYWRFEKARDGLVANEVSSLAELQIHGDVGFVGDWHNRALELARPGSSGFLTCKNELNLPPGSDYTVELWMKPSHNHCGGLVAMNSRQEHEPADPGAFCLLTWTRNRPFLRYLHRDPPGLQPKSGTDCYSSAPYRLRRWQHLVAVKRGPEMGLYLDGTLVGSNRDESALASHLCIIVGTSGIPREGKRVVRQYRFIGQLDELAIYGRALENAEIERHHRIVKSESGRAGDTPVKEI